MNAIVANMHVLATNMRALTTSIRDDTRKREEADLQVRIAAWKKREKEKARNAIAQLPTVIKDLAKKGKSRLIVQVEVTQPYLTADMMDTYKVLNCWDYTSLLETETPESGDYLSLYKVRNLRDGARIIARWALREGFTVIFLKWDDELRYERVQNCDFMNVDQLVTPVFASSRHGGGWPVQEGFMISW